MDSQCIRKVNKVVYIYFTIVEASNSKVFIDLNVNILILRFSINYIRKLQQIFLFPPLIEMVGVSVLIENYLFYLLVYLIDCQPENVKKKFFSKSGDLM